MSDGFVTAGQCVEGLPLGRCVWEILMCGFLAWFMLGAINESAPLSFSLLGSHTEQGVIALSASLAFGNFVAVLLGGYLADVYGRLAVVRPSILMTICSSMLLQLSRNLPQAVAARFLLGLASGPLFGVLPPLIAELVPTRHRGFYLTVWCSGWPLGGLASIVMTWCMPALGTRALYTLIVVPAISLYVCTRCDMLPESPRYLYLVGRRDEGYLTLIDMYEKQMLPLPWAPETIGVHSAPSRDREAHKLGMSANTPVAIFLALAMFVTSAAAQSMKLWMPTMLVAQQVDTANAVAGVNNLPPQLAQFLLDQEGFHMGTQTFAAGPRAMSLLSVAHAPLMLREPNYVATMVLMQGYLIQMFGVIVCAYLSSWISRRSMVQWSLLTATAFTLGTLAVAESGFLLLCGPLVGLQLASQAASLNFLQLFTSEHFPTSSRATTTAIVSFAAQLGNFTIPVVGGFVVQRVSARGAVIFFSLLYLVGWLLAFRLPLQTGREQPLHDLDEPAPAKRVDERSKKREWATYQTI
jgi:MFS family permease